MEDKKQNLIIDVSTNADESAKKVDNLTDSVDTLGDSTEKTEAITKSFKAQLREANQELLKNSQLYGETSKEAVKSAQKVAELRDQMEFAKNLTESFNPDQKFKALTSATQLSATSVSALTSGMALFGDQTEDTEKMLLKVQSAMAFSDSISSLSEMGDQWQTLKTVISTSSTAVAVNTTATTLATGAQRLFGGAVDTTSTSFKVLKGAIIATGIGALVVGVGLLINNFDKVKKVVLNLVPGLASVGEFIGSIVESVTDFVGVTSDATRAVDKMLKDSEASIEKNTRFLETQGYKYDEYTKRKIQANIDYNTKVAELTKEGQALSAKDAQYLKDLRKATDAEIMQADKDRQAEKDKARQSELAKEKKVNDEKRKKQLDENKKSIENQNALLNELEKLSNDDLKKAKENEDKAKKENELRQLTDSEREIQLVKDKYTELLTLAEQTGQSKKELEIAQANEINDILLKDADLKRQTDEKNKADESQREQALADGKKAIQDATINNISAGISLVSNLFGKNKAIQKGALIAESAVGVGKIVINTQTANAVAAASPMNAADPTYATRMRILNGISAGIGIASNIAATAKALQSLGGGSAGSATSVGGTNGGSVPKVGFQVSAENQIANTINNKQNEQQPIKTYVVASEVTTAQSLNRNKILANSI